MNTILLLVGAAIALIIAGLGLWLASLDANDKRKRRIEVSVASLGAIGAIIGLVAGYVSITSSADDARRLSAAQVKAASAEESAATARKESSQLSSALQAERLHRTDLEKSLAPRFILFNGQEAAQRLGPFQRTRAQIFSNSGEESIQTAQQLALLLTVAGCNVTHEVLQPGTPTHEGISIEGNLRDASDSLIDFLRQRELAVSHIPPHASHFDSEPEPGTLRITVGNLPSRHFLLKLLSPSDRKDWAEFDEFVTSKEAEERRVRDALRDSKKPPGR